MADNPTVNGIPVSGDDVGGVIHQRVKIEYGAENSAIQVSDASPLPVLPSGPGDQASTLIDGRKTSTTPGTAVALGTSQACKWVMVTALKTNTQDVWVGGSGVLGTLGSEVGTPLGSGESVTIPTTNRDLIFLDVRISGEGVTYTLGA